MAKWRRCTKQRTDRNPILTAECVSLVSWGRGAENPCCLLTGCHQTLLRSFLTSAHPRSPSAEPLRTITRLLGGFLWLLVSASFELKQPYFLRLPCDPTHSISTQTTHLLDQSELQAQ
jgi:hypothetical protein